MVDGSRPLRVVVQQLGIAAMPRFRVIVYGDDRNPLHSDFSGEQALLGAFRRAVPDLDLSQCSMNPLEEEKGSIVFTGELELDQRQLTILGLS